LLCPGQLACVLSPYFEPWTSLGAHNAPRASNDYMVAFDIKNRALALPRPLDYYVSNGLTSNALLTNLKNLDVKFENMQEGGLPSRGIAGSNANFLPRFGFAY